MENNYKKCENMMMNTHFLKIDIIKQNANTMDNEREVKWNNRAKSANIMNTYVNKMEIKNFNKSDSRNDKRVEQFRIK